MANLFGKKAKAPAMMPVDGRGIFITDTYAVAANPTAGDVINFRLPAGIELMDLKIKVTDMDTAGSPEILFRVGYAPTDTGSSLAANSTFFAAAGQTTAQGGGVIDSSFEPIKFEEDVYVTVTINTDALTFAAGTVTMIAAGSAIGPK